MCGPEMSRSMRKSVALLEDPKRKTPRKSRPMREINSVSQCRTPTKLIEFPIKILLAEPVPHLSLRVENGSFWGVKI